jgi:hypothetical protein
MSEKFEVGDVVEAFGERGTIVSVREEDYSLYKVVLSEVTPRVVLSFNSQGKYFDWQKEPSLKLIEKAKKEEPKKKYYKMIYKDRMGDWSEGSYLVDENFKTFSGAEAGQDMERKLLTDWSIEL